MECFLLQVILKVTTKAPNMDLSWLNTLSPGRVGGGGGVLPCMGYIGMCRCDGYGF